MRTITTHFLFLALTTLGFTAVSHADGPGKTSSKPTDTVKVAKSDPVQVNKVEPAKVTKVEPVKVTKVEVQPKIDVNKAKVEPVVVKKETDKVVKKVDVIKTPTMTEKRVVQIHDVSKVKTDAKLPGIKLPAGTKVDHQEFAKLQPKFDLTKVKPETVLASKPPTDFKIKKINLDQIQMPKDAMQVNSLHAGMKFNGEKFIMNKNFCATPDYFNKHAVKCGFGYCFPGKIHTHWHHCIWDPCYSCHYYYCPTSCCYYYWSEVNFCYYPCHWFVEYQGCSYPWWLCGGFESFGYCGSVGVSINIGISIR